MCVLCRVIDFVGTRRVCSRFHPSQSRLELLQAEAEATTLALKRWARIADSKENQLTQMKLKLARLLTDNRSTRATARDSQRDAVVKYRKLLVEIARAKFKRGVLQKEVRAGVCG